MITVRVIDVDGLADDVFVIEEQGPEGHSQTMAIAESDVVDLVTQLCELAAARQGTYVKITPVPLRVTSDT